MQGRINAEVECWDGFYMAAVREMIQLITLMSFN